MKKVFAFHLFNDYSGSPKVLGQLLKGWVRNNLEVHLTTSLNQEGFLSNIDNVHYHSNPYTFQKNKLLRIFSLFYNQLWLMIKMWRKVNREDIIYINTILPFGAGVLGKLKGCRIIYHVHETSISPKIFKRFLFGILKWTATEVIYVSKYLADEEPLEKKQTILYNAIETEFLQKAKKHQKEESNLKNVLMVCSLKKYKGVDEFCQLARQSSAYQFRLVVNASPKQIAQYFEAQKLPNNLSIYPSQKDVHPFYQWADIVLNLSRPDMWVETFGLTAIEAMAYGLPVIVPPVGGIAELVENGNEGYKVDSRQSEKLQETLQYILNNEGVYQQLSQTTKRSILRFSEHTFIQQSLAVLT